MGRNDPATDARPGIEYPIAQKKMLQGPVGAAHLAFWREELADAPAVLALPTDLPRPSSQRGPGASQNIVIPSSLGRQLARVARDHGATLFTLLFSAFN